MYNFVYIMFVKNTFSGHIIKNIEINMNNDMLHKLGKFCVVSFFWKTICILGNLYNRTSCNFYKSMRVFQNENLCNLQCMHKTDVH